MKDFPINIKMDQNFLKLISDQINEIDSKQLEMMFYTIGKSMNVERGDMEKVLKDTNIKDLFQSNLHTLDDITSLSDMQEQIKSFDINTDTLMESAADILNDRCEQVQNDEIKEGDYHNEAKVIQSMVNGSMIDIDSFLRLQEKDLKSTCNQYFKSTANDSLENQAKKCRAATLLDNADAVKFVEDAVIGEYAMWTVEDIGDCARVAKDHDDPETVQKALDLLKELKSQNFIVPLHELLQLGTTEEEIVVLEDEDDKEN